MSDIVGIKDELREIANDSTGVMGLVRYSCFSV